MNNFEIDTKSNIDFFFKNIDCKKFKTICNYILNCKGNIFFCGVGKNEQTAIHTSNILKSLGIKCFNLSPLNILHGDIGLLTDNDIIFIYSKSGNTIELIEPCKHMKKKCKIIGIFCNNNNKLSEFCNDILFLPLKNEIDEGFSIIPTNSILIQILFCNLLAKTIIEKKSINLKQYGENHPLGNIGKKIWTKIKDIMITDFPKLKSNNIKSIFDILLEMTNKKLGICIIINDKNEIEGIITDGDIRRQLLENKLDKYKINKNFISINNENKYVREIDTKILDNSFIPILKNKNVVGILQSSDINFI